MGLGTGSVVSSLRLLYEVAEAGCPSGQREQTVNLSAYAYAGSNPAPATHALQRQSRPLTCGNAVQGSFRLPGINRSYVVGGASWTITYEDVLADL